MRSNFGLEVLFWLEQLEIKKEVRKKTLEILLENNFYFWFWQAKRKKWVSGAAFGLTESGLRQIFKLNPLWKCWRRGWNGDWWLLTFDLTTRLRWKRLSFVRYLYSLGFGHLQKSIFVSPWNWENQIWVKFTQLVGRTPQLGEVALFCTKSFPKDKIEECWRLEQVGALYKKLSQAKDIKILTENLIENLKLDPFLPQKIDPLKNLRDEAFRNFKSRLYTLN